MGLHEPDARPFDAATSAAGPLIDAFTRRISYVRISVTDRCDFRCVYCMSENMHFLPKADLLTIEELERLGAALISRGVSKIRLTGGEPLVRRNVMQLFRALARHLGRGLSELTLTTNGSQLDRFADELAECGVRRVNVSLDTLDPDKFRRLTRWGDPAKVLAGIEAAQRAGLRVKINCVALKGVNDDEFLALTEWAHGRGMDISFIEVMPLGEDAAGNIEHLSAARSGHRGAGEKIHADAFGFRQRRPGTLFRYRRNRRARRLDHAAQPQFLRKLQSRARHLYGNALHVPRPGKSCRSARAIARLCGRRRPSRRARRGHAAQAART